MDKSYVKMTTKKLGITIDTGEMLIREIEDLNATLVRVDEDSIQSMESIEQNTVRISNILQKMSDKKLNNGIHVQPINCLLSVGPLARTEIPLDLLNQLISIGFEMNCTNANGYMCLDIAVEKHHYNAIRLLVKNGARSNSDNCKSVIPPVTSLAGQHNVPLDLFDLLATPENLNNSSPGGCLQLPLHTAASCGHIQTALQLIKLGASVDQQDGLLKLPIDHLMEKQSNLLNKNELFMSLLPQKVDGVHILKTIFGLQRNARLDKDNACLLEMFHQLLQRLHFNEPLRVELKTAHSFAWQEFILLDLVSMVINKVDFCSVKDFGNHNAAFAFRDMYLCSLILKKLQVYFISTPREILDQSDYGHLTRMELSYVHAINCVWKSYHQQCHVASLLRLCILCTRSSMSSLDDASFMSLPVPPYIRRLLTYRDIAEEILEEWCYVPTISS